MLEYEVTNRAGLIAAVNAAAQTTFAAAEANPVRITWGRCTYRFAEGIHVTRARQLVRDIRRVVPARGCRMRFGSVCSGKSRTGRPAIGWKAAWLAEIEKFPAAVLAHHYPEVPNLGDMTKIALPPNTLEQDMQKQCTKCGETKLLPDAFHLSSKSSDGHASWCKACVNSIRRENRKRTYTTENKRKWAIKTRYGLTPSDVQAMLEKQGGACAICVLPLTKHHIDHCHTTGKVRGLLCHRCNTRLGGLDDKQWRDAALRYLGLQA